MEPSTDRDDAEGEARRPFLVRFLAGAMGAVLALVPLVAGTVVFFDPLRRKNKAEFVRLTSLEGVPDNGVPQLFPVIMEREDVWNLYPPEPVGAVYLVRNQGEQTPAAFTATCPHAGCFVNYTPGEARFKCPCHTSTFKLDGERARGDSEVAPRGMDELNVELRTSPEDPSVQEVWVEFQRFRKGIHEKIPV